MGLEGKHLHDLIAGIYDAAVGAMSWPALLETMQRAFDAPTGIIAVAKPPVQSAELLANTGMSDVQLADYAQHHVRRDPWIPAGLALPLNRAYLSQQLLSDAVFAESEFWSDFARWVGPGVFCGVGAGLDLGDGSVALLALSRPRDARRFGAADRAALDLLLPHVRRSLILRQRLLAAQEHEALGFAALERLAIGAVFARENGTVLFANAAARAIAGALDGLSLGNGQAGVSAARPSETNRLRAMIARAALTTVGRGECSGGAMSLSRPSQRRPYVIVVSPLSPRSIAAPVALVLIRDPEEHRPVSRDILMQLFRLTGAEARLALELGAGASLGQAAERFAVSINTVRTQLRQVLTKTDSKRQADLVRLLSRLDLLS